MFAPTQVLLDPVSMSRVYCVAGLPTPTEVVYVTAVSGDKRRKSHVRDNDLSDRTSVSDVDGIARGIAASPSAGVTGGRRRGLVVVMVVTAATKLLLVKGNWSVRVNAREELLRTAPIARDEFLSPAGGEVGGKADATSGRHNWRLFGRR